MSEHLVRWIPLRIPMQLAAGAPGGLLHATPREAFTRFASIEEAQGAINWTAARAVAPCPAESFEILSVDAYEIEKLEPRARRTIPRAAIDAAAPEREESTQDTVATGDKDHK